MHCRVKGFVFSFLSERLLPRTILCKQEVSKKPAAQKLANKAQKQEKEKEKKEKKLQAAAETEQKATDKSTKKDPKGKEPKVADKSTKKKAVAETDQDEQYDEEGGEEETKETDPEVTVKPLPVTLQNVQTHRDLLAAKGFSGEQLAAAFKLLPASEQQLVWKKFETSRKSTHNEADYKKETVGAGAQVRKHALLRGWLADGGACAKHYRSATLSLKAVHESKVRLQWSTWRQIKNKFGKKEALDRVQSGTIRFRKSPSDKRFLEFADVSEIYDHVISKTQESKIDTKGGRVKTKDLRALDGLDVEGLQVSDFDLSGVDVEKMDLDPDLKSLIMDKQQAGDSSSEHESEEDSNATTLSLPPKDKKTKRKRSLSKGGKASSSKTSREDKWEKASEIGSKDGKTEFEKKLLFMKGEIQKDITFFESVMIDLKGKPMKKDDKKSLQDTVADLQKSLSLLTATSKGGCKKEDVKKALLASLSALRKSKKAKRMQISKKQKSKDESD